MSELDFRRKFLDASRVLYALRRKKEELYAELDALDNDGGALYAELYEALLEEFAGVCVEVRNAQQALIAVCAFHATGGDHPPGCKD